MGHQGRKIESHVNTGIGPAEWLAIEINLQRQVQPPTIPGITQLLADLRYRVLIEPCEGLGPIPVVSLESCVPSFRPSDELIQTATRFSGVPAFIELIAKDAVSGLEDPIREKIESL